MLILWLRIEKDAFIEMKNDFLMRMSIILRTVVLIDVREDGQEPIESISYSRSRFKRSSSTAGKGCVDSIIRIIQINNEYLYRK